MKKLMVQKVSDWDTAEEAGFEEAGDDREPNRLDLEQARADLQKMLTEGVGAFRASLS